VDSYKNITDVLKICFMQDLCVYCNNDTGYYPFYNLTLFNGDTFTDCYKELEGYFLDNDNAYKPCFNTCKTCSKEGNETNNNCIECIDNYILLNDSSNDVLNNCYIECGENYYYFDSLNKYHCTDMKKCPDKYKLIKEKNKCIDNCTKDDVFYFEYNNSCLRECPPNHTEINNICLKVPDTVVDTNIPIINSDTVIDTNLSIINSDTVIDTNLPIINSDIVIGTNSSIINSDTVIDINLPIINSDIVIGTNSSIINSDTVIDTNLPTINSESVVDTNLPIINSDTVIGTNSSIINSDTVIGTNLPTINSDTAIGTNLPTINLDTVIGTNLPTINSESVVDTNLPIINSDTVISTNLPTINSDTVIGANLPTINSDTVSNNILHKINSDTVVDTNLQLINSDSVIDTNIQKIYINEKGECPKDFPYKLQNERECVKECKASDVFKGICIINNKDPIINDIMINKTRNELINHKMDELLKDVISGKKENLITVQGNVIYTLTTSDNQKNTKQKNESTIYLRDCQNKLKDHYNISTNETLLIFKIDIFEHCSDNPIIEYEIYNSKTKEQLDLIYCQDIKIQINIPAKIDEKNEFKYTPSSDYYSDICFPYTTEYETDINLNDRRIEFFVNNLSICELNCDYEGYDSNLEKVACECYVKIKIPFMSKIIFNKDLLKRKFLDIKNLINLTVMKCYSFLFTSEGLLFNIGSYILLAIKFLNIILLIITISLKQQEIPRLKKVQRERRKKLKRKIRRNKRRKIKRIIQI